MLKRLNVSKALQAAAASSEFGDLLLKGEAEGPSQWHAMSLIREVQRQ